MFVELRKSDDASVVGFRYAGDLLTRIPRGLRQWHLRGQAKKFTDVRPPGGSLFSDDRSRHGAQILKQLPSWDVLHLHWISGMLDYSEFFIRLPQDRPVVWTLHDMHAFTGGCHFDGGCDRFSDSCGLCPQLNSVSTNDFSRQSWARKRLAYRALNTGVLHLATPSQWLAGEVRRSSLLGDHNITVIPYGLDTRIFGPRDQRAARDVLSLPPEGRLALFVADWTAETRKGLPLLLEALRAMPHSSRPRLLTLGRGPLAPPEIPCVQLDPIGDDRILSFVYSAADIFVLPTLQDNLPNTALEAMACGLPVVAFATGGVPEMIRDGIEGCVVPTGDVAALRSAIAATLQNEPRRAEMAVNSRRRAMQEYRLELQAQRYLDLYRSLRSPEQTEKAQ